MVQNPVCRFKKDRGVNTRYWFLELRRRDVSSYYVLYHVFAGVYLKGDLKMYTP